MQERKLMEMVEAAGTIAIVGHVRPDGDCVGSCLAVCNYITEQYPEKTVDVYLETPPAKFSYLKQFERISSDSNTGKQYELCICLDSGDRERLGNNVVYLDTAKTSICLDHHITNKGYAAKNFVNANASATCEFLYDFLDEEKISKEVAECIYTGIIHDTNVFKNSNTTAKTMEVAGAMMEKGINFSQIIDGSFYKKTYVQNQIMGRAVLESVLFLDGKCIFSVVRKQDMDFYGVEASDLDGIVDQLRVTDGVEVAIFLHETENHVYKVSMRSNNFVNVSKVASFFGGGGHVRAAGCTMSGSVHDVINNLSARIEKQIKEHDA
ncbi:MULTISPECIES: bifunctional oligoribonuclease/PAP phosphatase NrnA [unclassified Clostridium]|uniref:DHH family phosphoesterase n=1 Tax=unclassified Clostridium TaxID=2614128 RepID=UPI000E50662E|nr:MULTISPECIES: bifunctional oligoribonuclease/PAP phosphatase NrnA [unclassified Clostridium]RHP43983.1 bifunctional oligoribonuclease/PAP phosphatase NrnA [Clostridium sp. AF32-12BH]RHV66464.1 bifunctional oligoribonuclease/PAP phosphatase NrnA [Clostridium sp. OM02-18AC]HBM48408.1 DHH family phosphoesterase [Lachnoclostridium sp.]